jgi:hypothetical protein
VTVKECERWSCCMFWINKKSNLTNNLRAKSLKI